MSPEFLAWLREHLHEPLTLADLAVQAGLSERGLVRKFRQATGTTVFDWLGRERVASAKVLLLNTHQSLAEIAERVGLGSTETLRRQFTRYAGTTPGAFRRAAITPLACTACGR